MLGCQGGRFEKIFQGIYGILEVIDEAIAQSPKSKIVRDIEAGEKTLPQGYKKRLKQFKVFAIKRENINKAVAVPKGICYNSLVFNLKQEKEIAMAIIPQKSLFYGKTLNQLQIWIVYPWSCMSFPMKL